MNRWQCLLRLWLAVLFIVLPFSKAAALDWVVVPYGVSDPASASRAADRLVHALAERRVAVASQHELKDVFLRRSRAHIPLDSRQSKLIADARRRALDHAAYGRRDAARRAAEEVMHAAESAPEAVLRDTDLARHVLDACLAVVRVDLQERDRALAVQDAQRCRRLVPDLAPRESTHSAEVVGALAEAENELRRAGAGALTIESSAIEGCAVFLNGRRLGTTPFRYEHAPLGPTTVFLECGAARSRVHQLQLGEPEQALWIDPGSEGRIAERDVIALVYASEQELTDHLAADTRALAATAGARNIVMLRELPGGPFEAVRYDANRQQLVAAVQIEAKRPFGAELLPAEQQAAEALALERRDAPIPLAFQPRPEPVSADVVESERSSTLTRSESSQPVQREPARSRRRRVWTWAFGAATPAAGGVSLGLGLFVNDREQQQRSCDPDAKDCDAIIRSTKPYERATNAMLGVTGGLAVATLVSFFVEGRKRQPSSVSLAIAPHGVLASGSF